MNTNPQTEVCKGCGHEWPVSVEPRENVLCSGCASSPTLPEGEVRRDASGTIAVCLGGSASGLRWKVVGEDPFASVCHGWRYDRDVRLWSVVGNVYDLAGEVARV